MIIRDLARCTCTRGAMCSLHTCQHDTSMWRCTTHTPLQHISALAWRCCKARSDTRTRTPTHTHEHEHSHARRRHQNEVMESHARSLRRHPPEADVGCAKAKGGGRGSGHREGRIRGLVAQDARGRGGVDRDACRVVDGVLLGALSRRSRPLCATRLEL